MCGGGLGGGEGGGPTPSNCCKAAEVHMHYLLTVQYRRDLLPSWN
jgi:hypothetical protein